MIKNLEQCERIQQKRVDAKKRGYSKAVRTFVRNEAAKTVDDNYRETMNTLPVNWY